MYGWFRLPRSGGAYYGRVPDGAEVLDGPPAVDAPACPAPSAPKGAWVDYAVAVGWSPEDAQRKTKGELVAELGEQDVDAGEGGDAVGTEVPALDLASDALQVITLPDGSVVVDEQLDGDLDGHED